MRWPWQKPEAPPPAEPQLPGTPKLECPACGFTHFQPMGELVNAHIVDGRPVVVHSGLPLGCSRCYSTLRLTGSGLQLVKREKAVDDPPDEQGDRKDDDDMPDTDLRMPRHERRRLRASRQA